MRLRLLGPVELHGGDGPLDPGSGKQRCVLAALGLSPGSPVAIDSLIGWVWGDDPPRDVRNVLYSYVSRLRRLLRGSDVRIERGPGSYVLRIDPERVDTVRFRALVRRAREVADPARRAEALAEALALWRGEPLAGLPGERAAGVRAELNALRLSALGDRIDADLAAGGGSGLVDELNALSLEYPLDERFAGQLMRALCAVGRRSDALAEFQRLRRGLADELGVDPGDEVDRLHLRILRNEPVTTAGAATPTVAVPRQLPAQPATFVGRDRELAAAVAELSRTPRDAPPVVAVNGPGGVGKSALAVAAAHAVAPRYPDGQLHLDLQGASADLEPLEPVDAIGRLLRALGEPVQQLPDDAVEGAARLRTALAGRRVLLLLDNAASSGQVRALLPATPDCGVLITSRTVLANIENAMQLAVTVLGEALSATLLRALDRTGRLADDPDSTARIATMCGHLPLGLRIAAARMAARPGWPAAAFAERMSRQQRRLDQLGYDDVSVRACFQVSLDGLQRSEDPLDGAAATAFRLLGLPDGPDISSPLAARLLDWDEPATEAALDRLVDTHLLTAPAPNRYQMHDLLRLYARELAETIQPAQAWTALERMWSAYLAILTAANDRIRPGYRQERAVQVRPAVEFDDRKQALDWVATESPNLLAAANQAVDAPGERWKVSSRLAHQLFATLSSSGRWRELYELTSKVRETARHRHDRHSEGQSLVDLGIFAWRSGEGDRATALLEESLAVHRDAGDRLGEAASLHNLGIAHANRGRRGAAQECLEAALAIRRAEGSLSGEADSLAALGAVCMDEGDIDAAVEALDAGLAAFDRLGDDRGRAQTYDDLGKAWLLRGEVSRSVDYFERALLINRELGFPLSEVWNLTGLATALTRAGDAGRAAGFSRDALRLSRDIGAQQEEAVAFLTLGEALAELGDAEGAQAAWREAVPIFQRLGIPELEQVTRLIAEAEASDETPAPDGHHSH